MRRRLDTELVRRGLAASRAQAQAVIAAGQVLVSGTLADRASRLVLPGEPVVLTGEGPRFVSRGGDKLDAALDHFEIDPSGSPRARRRGVHRWLHRLPLAAWRGARRRRRRRPRPARCAAPCRPARDSPRADQRASPHAGGSRRSGRHAGGRPLVHLSPHGRPPARRAHRAQRHAGRPDQAAVRSRPSRGLARTRRHPRRGSAGGGRCKRPCRLRCGRGRDDGT